MDYKNKLKQDSAYNLLFRNHLLSVFNDYNKKIKILEIGPGAGYLLQDLINLGFEDVYAVDKENYLISSISKKVNFTKSDLSYDTLPFENNYFDLIVSIQVIEHIENPWHFISETKRVLKEDSKLLLSFPSSKDIFSRLKFLREGNVYSFTDKNNHVSFFTNSIQKKLFRGFVIKKEIYTKTPITMLRSYLLRKLIRDLLGYQYFPQKKSFSIKTLYFLSKENL